MASQHGGKGAMGSGVVTYESQEGYTEEVNGESVIDRRVLVT